MKATAPEALQAQLHQLWERGAVLREALGGPTRFPVRLKFSPPTAADLTGHYAAVRTWVAAVAALPYLRLEWQTVAHRVQGPQRLPVQAWVDTPAQVGQALGKQQAIQHFAALVADTRALQPALLAWLERRPLQALEYLEIWPQLRAVTAWLLAHPRPGIYLRQVDLPGISSKFIEQHRTVLTELLDLVLPSTAVDASQTGVDRFPARYGFRSKPTRIRLRILDARLALWPGITYPDLTLDATSFSQLDWPLQQVFITENETNFLAFPPVASAIVIFGAGYGWTALAEARWLSRCALYYWGDLDTHGFAILDQLRRVHPHAVSWLMDQETLLAHREFWTWEPQPTHAELTRLTDAEQTLYQQLRHNQWGTNLRLEQEQVRFGWLTAQLATLS